MLCLVAVEGSFHLFDGCDYTLCLFGHVVLLAGDESHLVMKCLGEGREQLLRLVSSVN